MTELTQDTSNKVTTKNSQITKTQPDYNKTSPKKMSLKPHTVDPLDAPIKESSLIDNIEQKTSHGIKENKKKEGVKPPYKQKQKNTYNQKKTHKNQIVPHPIENPIEAQSIQENLSQIEGNNHEEFSTTLINPQDFYHDEQTSSNPIEPNSYKPKDSSSSSKKTPSQNKKSYTNTTKTENSKKLKLQLHTKNQPSKTIEDSGASSSKTNISHDTSTNKIETASTGNKKMLISVIPGEQVEVAISSNGKLLEYFTEMTHHAKIRGNIYKGVINNIDANLQAAFVNYGNIKNGFLQIDEVHPEYYLQPHEPTKGRKYPPIQKVLKAGQEILVQVVKEPTGNKGAFLTTWLSLAGRFLVLTPGQEQIGISRKVENEEERNRLRELIKGLEPGSGLGAIVRTVSIGTSKTTLQKDLSFLKRVWKEIRKKATTEKSPCLIYQEPGLATRAVRDYLADDITEVWVDDPETTNAIKEVTTLLFPRKTRLVHLYQNHNEPLWEHFKLNKQITQVHSREVIMPSGGRLVFDQTEALMAIDINSGRIAGKTNFESMAYRTNMEAAATIAQQLRLRDVGGQIVIDFIEMKEHTHCRDVEKELQLAMKADRARHDVGKMSSFGLLQVVRQRTGSSAISITQEPCPYCHGTGQRRNIEWQAVQTLRDIHKKMQQASSSGKQEYIHTLDQELGLYILNHKRARLLALEQEFGIHLNIYISLITERTYKD